MKVQYSVRQVGTIYAMAFCTPIEIPFMDLPDNSWLLNRLFVVRERRGRHYGSIMIDRVCREADEEHVTLLLGIDPDTDSPLQRDALESFYGRHGFVYDPQYDTMTRSPQWTKSEQPQSV